MVELPRHLSPSSASSFDQCRKRWRFKYVEGLREPSGVAALSGSFAHRVLELLCELPAKLRSVDQAKALAREVWPDFTTDPDFQALELDDDDSREFRWKAWLAVSGLWKLEDPALVEVVSTEQRVKVKLGDVPFVGVIDRVDRIDNGLVVSDYKSGSVPRTQWRDDKVLQVMLYAAALQATTGEQPSRARLLYLGQQIIEETVTDSRIENATSQISTTWSNINAACENDDFPADTGPLCGWCPFVDRCPDGRAEVEKRASQGRLAIHAPAIEILGLDPVEAGANS